VSAASKAIGAAGPHLPVLARLLNFTLSDMLAVLTPLLLGLMALGRVVDIGCRIPAGGGPQYSAHLPGYACWVAVAAKGAETGGEEFSR
jgi:hypothetical protein